VAVSASPGLAGVGLDIEVDTSLTRELEKAVFTEAERAWLDGRPPRDRGRLAKLLFSAKEAVYKCQYPVTHTILEFHGVELAVELGLRTFTVANVTRADARCLERLVGAFATPDGFIVSTAVLARN